MNLHLLLAMCAFPTSFDDLWKIAAICCGAWIITAMIVFCQKRVLRPLIYLILLVITLLGSIWSLALAIATSRNVLICAGVSDASADLVREADESSATLVAFQFVVMATVVATIVLILIGVSMLYYSRQRPMQ